MLNSPYLRWLLSLPLVILLIPVSRVAGLFATLQMVLTDKRVHAPAWAWWAAPFDHTFSGPGIDPMWQGYWGGSHTTPAWYVKPLRKLGVRDPSHGMAIFMQFMRNGGAGANYRWFGLDVTDLTIVDGRRAFDSNRKLVGWYVSRPWPLIPGEMLLGYKLNTIDKRDKLPGILGLDGRRYVKIAASPWRL